MDHHPISVHLDDHFTVRNRHNHLYLQGRDFLVVDNGTSQTILEHEDVRDGEDLRYRLKHVSRLSFGRLFVNGLCVFACLMFLGFAFVFALDVVLNLFLGVLVEFVDTDETVTFATVFTLFAVPVLIHTLASAVTIATGFLMDIWNQFRFFRLIGTFGPIASDWLAFAVILFVPFLLFAVTLLASVSDFLRVSLLGTFFCYMALYSAYALAVVYYEVVAAFHMIRSRNNAPNMTTWEVCKRLIFLRIQFTYSVYASKRTLNKDRIFRRTASDISEIALHDEDIQAINNRRSIGLGHPGDGRKNHEDGNGTTTAATPNDVNNTARSHATQSAAARDDNLREPVQEVVQVDNHFHIRDSLSYTLWWINWMGEKLKHAPFHQRATGKRIWSVNDAHQVTPFITESSWSLSELFCVARDSRTSIKVVNGKYKVTADQWSSSLLCVLIMLPILLLFVVGILVFFDMGVGFVIFVGLLIGLWFVHYLYNALISYRRIKHGMDECTQDGDGLDAYFVWETARVKALEPSVAMFVLGLDLLLLYLLPLVALCMVHANLAVIFALLGIVSGVRHFCNVRVLLQEFGPSAMGMLQRKQGSFAQHGASYHASTTPDVEAPLPAQGGDVVKASDVALDNDAPVVDDGDRNEPFQEAGDNGSGSGVGENVPANGTANSPTPPTAANSPIATTANTPTSATTNDAAQASAEAPQSSGNAATNLADAIATAGDDSPSSLQRHTTDTNATHNPPTPVATAETSDSTKGNTLDPREAQAQSEQALLRHLDETSFRDKQRLNIIVNKMSHGGVRYVSIIIFSIAAVIAGLLLVASSGQEDYVSTSKDNMVFMSNSRVIPLSNDLQYPTCSLKGTNWLNGTSSDDEVLELLDFAFLSHIAYVSENSTQQQLDTWFTHHQATLNKDIVDEFRAQYTTNLSPVSFKLIQFPDRQYPLSVVAVRGTVNAFDMFADMQLWMSALFLQLVRFFLPAGDLWTPIFPDLVKYIAILETENMQKVSYYIQVTEFVRFLQEKALTDPSIGQVSITGHSLGGGISIISGAQTQVPTIAFSGPNAMLSRKKFDPPVTVDQLNRNVLNVIPQRDPVPRVDDVALLSQEIECTAPTNDFVACHTMLRTLCELMYKCGSKSRPALCECEKFGYPSPNFGEVYDDVCPPIED